MLLKFSMTTHKERVLNQKPTTKLNITFLKKKFCRQILVAMEEKKHRFKVLQIPCTNKLTV